MTENIDRNDESFVVCVCVCACVGDAVMRPQSEFKVSTPVDKPPSAPLSAPPNVIEQAKLDCKIY